MQPRAEKATSRCSEYERAPHPLPWPQLVVWVSQLVQLRRQAHSGLREAWHGRLVFESAGAGVVAATAATAAAAAAAVAVAHTLSWSMTGRGSLFRSAASATSAWDKTPACEGNTQPRVVARGWGSQQFFQAPRTSRSGGRVTWLSFNFMATRTSSTSLPQRAGRSTEIVSGCDGDYGLVCACVCGCFLTAARFFLRNRIINH